MLEYKEKWIKWYKSEKSKMQCRFDPLYYNIFVFLFLTGIYQSFQKEVTNSDHGLLSYFIRVPTELLLDEDEADPEIEVLSQFFVFIGIIYFFKCYHEFLQILGV
uniref:Transmembrane protein n=1 Tax=Heterorhabditis bacteriophora TaxID=37862 RepID=A0A1I7WXQ6_HETBA